MPARRTAARRTRLPGLEAGDRRQGVHLWPVRR
jgi:hypothetical protein